MENKTFTFTIEQLKDIFDDGALRGYRETVNDFFSEEGRDKAFVYAIYDAINKDKFSCDDGYVPISEIREWVK